jgi:hypothetical protein
MLFREPIFFSPPTDSRRLGVFRRTETNNSRLLAKRLDTGTVCDEINLRLLGGGVNRYADGQEVLFDASGRVDVEQSAAA